MNAIFADGEQAATWMKTKNQMPTIKEVKMSEQAVKRYDYGYVDDGNGSRYLGLIERDTGELVRHDDYDALRAEAEALRVALLGIASVNPSERGIEWAKSYASDGLKGAGSELYARWLDTFKEAEALRAQVSALQSDANSWQSGYDKGREDGAKAAEGWKAQHARDSAELRRLCAEREALAAEFEAIKGQQPVAFYWQDIGYPEPRKHGPYFGWPSESALRNVDGGAIPVPLYTLPPATLSPEVQASGPYASVAGALAQRYPKPSLLKDCNVSYSNSSRPLAEQGERQEAAAEYQQLSRYGNWDRVDKAVYDIGKLGDTPEKFRALYTTPQPGPDVRALAASLYQACGAYDMPERILDALSAAANGEPFTHMIDGLLPCVPPSGEGVRALVAPSINPSTFHANGEGATK